ncbi:desmethyl-deoxy-podophyllotoxin synthase-like [Oryza brachyantha]|uniref:desmethyl-deoxy-podophyllotoxin synthase-like n=1 Tax=Oryza brachyantha TaxID=4533 RepID=UPI001ADC026D|nr:desmethyl-deoxy-podophyllotoxin synthase-like [Oryza brachyantha]
MAELPLYLLLLALLLAVPFLSPTRSSRRRGGGGSRPPPSPWALPVIGHLHHVAGALPHRAMRRLARRHGPLMLLRLCELRVVVASSAEAARAVLRTHDLAFATRPVTPTGKVLMRESLGVVFAPYGDGWRALRRICTLELLSARRVRSFRAVREEEAGRLLRAVAALTPPPCDAGAGAGAVNLSERISAYVADSAVRAIVGSRFKNRAAFLRMLERRMKLLPAQCLPDLFPSSRAAMLLSGMPRRMKRERREMMDFIDTIFQEHHESRAAAAAAGGDEEDLLDVLLRIQSQDKTNPVLTTENIKTVIIDIFVASSETAATSLQWTMSELVRNPRVMRKAQDEVRRVLAGQDWVTEESLGDLHYLRLVIKESLRLHPPVTMLLPRDCREPCQVLGFDVPEGAMVLVNAWAIGRDPAHWDAPEEFAPERFEQRGGAAPVADFKGTDFEYIPFGAGRRMCPGMAFGLANMELALAGLLYHFDWEVPGGGELDMTEALGITTRRRSDLLLVPAVRVPLRDV